MAKEVLILKLSSLKKKNLFALEQSIKFEFIIVLSLLPDPFDGRRNKEDILKDLFARKN